MPDGSRGSAAHHLLTPTASLLLDCGPGTLHALARYGVDWRRLTHVVISHFHNDHLGDLPALLNAFKHASRQRAVPLVLAGPPGFERLLGALAAVYGDHVLEQRFGLEIVELNRRDALSARTGEIELQSCPTTHTDESVAFRVEGAWGALGYTGDTGPSQDVEALFAGIDVLIAECTLADPPTLDTHLSPVRLAKMATVLGPRLLVVTHVAPPQSPEVAVELVLELYDGRTIAGVDGMEVAISADDVTVDLPRSPV